MFPCFFVGLFRPDPDEFLEDVAHLDVVHAVGREVDGGEFLHHEVKQILFGHFCDLHVECKTLHDRADIRRKTVNVAVEVGRELVRVVQQTIEATALFRLGHREL